MLLNNLEIFATVVQTGSFSNAAHKLGYSKSFISMHVQQLEAALQAKLLIRTTRQLTLTEAGKNLYAHCQDALAAAQTAVESVNQLYAQPTGQLKISLPPAFGDYCLQPFLITFQQQYPDITLEIHYQAKVIDFIQHGFDFVLRSAKLEDTTYIAQQLTTAKSLLVASSQFLKNCNKLTKPSDLQSLPFINYNDTQAKKFVFQRNKKSYPVTLQPTMSCNHLALVKAFASHGAGFSILPDFMLKTELAKGKLQHCLPEYQLPSQAIYLIYAHRDYLPPKMRVFIDAIKQYVSQNLC